MKTPLKIVFCCIAAAVISLVGARIYAVNKAFPPVEIIPVNIGETAEINGLEIAPKAVEIISAADISGYSDPANGSGGEEKMLVFTVDIKNISGEEMFFPCYKFAAESGAWRNGLEQNAFFAMNDTDTLICSLEPEEEKEVKLCYALYEADMRGWEDIGSRDFSAVWLEYPRKVVVGRE